MPARTIVKWPDPRLCLRAESIKRIDDGTISLATDLRDTMYTSFGSGLAATQVGITKSICVIEYASCESSDLLADPVLPDVVVLVNPAIELRGKETFRWREACLSIDGFEAEVTRHSEISLDYQDLSGVQRSIVLRGQTAGIVQHETDHLIGKVFIDRLSSRKRRACRVRLLKRSYAIRSSRKKEALIVRREEMRQATIDREPAQPGYRSVSTKVSKVNSKKKRKGKTYGKNKGRKK